MIQFNISTLFSSISSIHKTIRCFHSGPGWVWEQWQWRSTLYSPKLQLYWNLTIRLFNVISRMVWQCATESLEQHSSGFEFKVFPSPKCVTLPTWQGYIQVSFFSFRWPFLDPSPCGESIIPRKSCCEDTHKGVLSSQPDQEANGQVSHEMYMQFHIFINQTKIFTF